MKIARDLVGDDGLYEWDGIFVIDCGLAVGEHDRAVGDVRLEEPRPLIELVGVVQDPVQVRGVVEVDDGSLVDVARFGRIRLNVAVFGRSGRHVVVEVEGSTAVLPHSAPWR